MKFNVVAKSESEKAEVTKALEKEGFIFSQEPDFVASIGGDGTFLIAERVFPNIPKLLIKDSNICNLCDHDNIHDLTKNIAKKDYSINSYFKLAAQINNKSMFAVNDIIIRNQNLIQAIRFTLMINNEQINKEFIGDGVVIATPFGSTAYYHSITKSRFDKGIGIAFNNITKHVDNIVADEESTIKIKITRGPGVLAFDNSPDQVELNEGDIITIKKSDQFAKIIKLGHHKPHESLEKIEGC